MLISKTTHFLVKLANKSDLYPIYNLELECFATDRITLDEYKKLLRKPNVKIFVVKIADKVIGSAIIILRRRIHVARIYSFGIISDFRGTNVANYLFNFIEEYLCNHQYMEIQLEVKKDNIAALKLYEKLGFSKFGEYKDYYEDGSDAFQLVKKLSVKITS